MIETKNNTLRAFKITIGVIGFFAGIFLTLNGYKLLGISGLVLCAGITIKEIYLAKKE